MRNAINGYFKHCNGIVLVGLLWAAIPGSLRAQMNMGPYFTTINYTLEEHSVMIMALPDFQAARFGPDFATGMLMAEYGITDRWTAGVMAEGQKISSMPASYGAWLGRSRTRQIKVSSHCHITMRAALGCRPLRSACSRSSTITSGSHHT